MGRCIREVGIGFLFAPAIHTATKHAQPARAGTEDADGVQHPGSADEPGRRQRATGGRSQRGGGGADGRGAGGAGPAQRGFVVHGSDGLDEITTTGPTLVFEIRDGKRVTRRTVTPEDFGVPRAAVEDLRGGDRETNCAIARSILSGARGPQRDIVLVNAAAALVAAGKAHDLREGVALAAESIDSGAAMRKVQQLARFTQQFG